MRAILGDINIQGQVRLLVNLLEGADWREFWDSLQLPLLTFRDLGLSPRATDSEIWELCQREEIILLTDNRNGDGPDSLEVTLRTRNTPNSLPVFTVANAQQLQRSKDYAERVVARLLEYLLNMDNLRGTGRLYLP